MKSEQLLLVTGALVLAWSKRSEAHDSFEAVSNGGSLLQLTRAAIHPLLESPYIPGLLIMSLMLGFLLGPVIVQINRRRALAKRKHATETDGCAGQ